MSIYTKNITNDQLSDSAFHAAFGGMTTLGLLITTLLALSVKDFSWMNLWSLIGLIVVAFAGVFVNQMPRIGASLLGYLMVCVPFGLLTAVTVSLYPAAAVTAAFMVAVGTSAVLWLVGWLIPAIRNDYGLWIIGLLAIFIIGLFVAPMFPALMTIWNILGVIIFGGLIVYDVNKATNCEDKSMVSASQNALSVYLDILNLFLTLLRLFGGSSSSD